MNSVQGDGILVRITDEMRERFITSHLTPTGEREDTVLKRDILEAFAQWLTDEHGRYVARIHPREAGKLYSLMEVILAPFTDAVNIDGHRIFVGLTLSYGMNETTPSVLLPGVDIPRHLRWRLTGEHLGSGGQGNVWLVTDQEANDGTKYALKVLQSPDSFQARRRFLREIEAIKEMNHHSIIQIYDYAKEDDGFQYYVMEYHDEAQSLDSIIASPISNPFHGNALLSLELFEQLIEAIAACQRNDPRVIHRDINPQNILLLRDGSIRLIDFGICHFENGETITLTDENVGRRNYTAPECEASGAPVIGVHSDIYSASKTLWSVITSRRAFSREEPVFNADSMQARFPDKTETWHIGRIFERTIRKDPSDRITNAGEVLHLLAEVRYKIERGYPPLELARSRCPSCGGKSFSELPDAESVFGPPNLRQFNAVQCNSCGLAILRNYDVWRKKISATKSFQ